VCTIHWQVVTRSANPSKGFGMRECLHSLAMFETDESRSSLGQLQGDFGPNQLHIVSMIASDPTNARSIYSNSDTITITFNQAICVHYLVLLHLNF
jgi:hypothetical protein